MENFIKIKLNDQTECSLLHTLIEDDSKFQIQLITADGHELKGALLCETVKETAAQLEFDFKAFWDIQTNILTTSSVPDIKFYLDEDLFMFSWKKDQTAVKITYGTVQLAECAGVREAVLRRSFKIIENLKKQAESQTQKLEDISLKQHVFQREFDKLVEREKGLQAELYGKFAAVLNAKKQKIIELKTMLFERDGEVADSQSDVGSQQTVKETAISREKRFLSTHSTDSDSPIRCEIPKRQKVIVENRAQPSTSVASTSKVESRSGEEAATAANDPYEVDTQMFDDMS